jgi:hypothetical protein
MLPVQTDSVGLQDAIQSQDAIGWDNVFEECIAKDSEQAQDDYYKWCRSRKSAWRWTIALIQKLWNVAWDLWEHRNGGIVHAAENVEILHGMAEIDNEIRAQFQQQGPHGLQGLFTAGPVNGSYPSGFDSLWATVATKGANGKSASITKASDRKL